jgi:hypothetical protein
MARQRDSREEIDVVSVDPLFIERQRDKYASRGLAYIVLLNGIAALGLLVGICSRDITCEAHCPTR